MRGMDEVAILATIGLIAALVAWTRSSRSNAGARGFLLPLAAGAAAQTATASAASPVALVPMFLVFAKAGSLLFGSGYVLLAFLRADLVERLGWLTNAQLLDAVVVGQVTPGPVFTTATFIGYRLAGMAGAVTATVGIFLPAFVFVALSAPIIPAMRRSRAAGAVLDAVNVASLALMANVTVMLARDTLVDALAIGLAAASAILLVRYRVRSSILIAAGAALGLLVG
jgi:chromate transporter